jgi:hypothetical protein
MIRALAVEVGPEDLEKLDIIPLTSTIHFGMTQNELWGVLQSARTGLKLLGHPESSPNLMLLNSVIAGQKPYMALDFTGKGGDLLTCSTLGTFAAHQPQPDWSIIPASARVSQLRESDFRSKITEFNTTLERALSIASAAIITSAGELLRRFADVMQKVVFSPDF